MGSTIIEDSRNKPGHHGHIEAWMRDHGVSFLPHDRALPFGDYMRDGSNVSVDTKKDVQELAMDCGRDHARFVRECERAWDAGYRLYILIEQHPEYNDRRRLEGWVSGVCHRCHHRMRGTCKSPSMQTGRRCPRGMRPMQGDTLAKILTTMELRYEVRFRFCRKQDAARIICELLGEEVDDGR